MASAGHPQHLYRSATALDTNGLMHSNASNTQYDLNGSSSGFVSQQSHAPSQPIPASGLGNASNVRNSLYDPIDATQPLLRLTQWPNHTGTTWTTSDLNQPTSSSLSSMYSSSYPSVQPPPATSSHSLHLPQHPHLAASNNTSSSSSSLAAAFPESSQRTSVTTPPTSTDLYHSVTSAMHDTTGDGSNNGGFATWLPASGATHDSGITPYTSASASASQPVSYNNYVQQNNSLLSYDIGAPQTYAGGGGGGAGGSYALTGYSSQQNSHSQSSTTLSHHTDPSKHFQSSSSPRSSPGESYSSHNNSPHFPPVDSISSAYHHHLDNALSGANGIRLLSNNNGTSRDPSPGGSLTARSDSRSGSSRLGDGLSLTRSESHLRTALQPPSSSMPGGTFNDGAGNGFSTSTSSPHLYSRSNGTTPHPSAMNGARAGHYSQPRRMSSVDLTRNAGAGMFDSVNSFLPFVDGQQTQRPNGRSPSSPPIPPYPSYSSSSSLTVPSYVHPVPSSATASPSVPSRPMPSRKTSLPDDTTAQRKQLPGRPVPKRRRTTVESSINEHDLGPAVLAFRLEAAEPASERDGDISGSGQSEVVAAGNGGRNGRKAGSLVLKPLDEHDDPFLVKIEDLKRESGEVWYQGMSHEFAAFGDVMRVDEGKEKKTRGRRDKDTEKDR